MAMAKKEKEQNKQHKNCIDNFIKPRGLKRGKVLPYQSVEIQSLAPSNEQRKAMQNYKQKSQSHTNQTTARPPHPLFKHRCTHSLAHFVSVNHMSFDI